MQTAHKDEIDLLQIAMAIWRSKLKIAGGMFLFAVLGGVYALLATPTFESNAIITPKVPPKGGGASGLLSQFGDIGGMIGSQLGVGANSSLDRMEIIVKGRELAETVITKHNLLPVLYRKDWDSAAGAWKTRDPERIPTVRKAVELMRDEIISANVNPKNSTLDLQAVFTDPSRAWQIVTWYLEALNDKIREDAQRDAENNLRYFESQLGVTTDPMLAEKVRQLMAMEIEKSMLVSSHSFDILEKPVIPIKKTKPKRALIVVLAAVFGLLLSLVLIFLREIIQGLALTSRASKKEGIP